ncbi:hypothetical protein [Roseospira goensis]|uniref:Uncharacterized protein n=1 Tax=Roseospira goensis TaxID=391922 RepID=A0A7W6RW78_9PROT|nr:hypothetical protein [Roseospira goensis]MBB4284389.1 hypothetical protein [Roseospira goensis]
MSLSHAFTALYAALEILATLDADLSHRLCVVYRRCLRSIPLDEVALPAVRTQIQTVRDRLAAHDPEGAAGAAATRTSRVSDLPSQEMEDLARQIVDLYMDLLLGARSGADTTRHTQGGEFPPT